MDALQPIQPDMLKTRFENSACPEPSVRDGYRGSSMGSARTNPMGAFVLNMSDYDDDGDGDEDDAPPPV